LLVLNEPETSLHPDLLPALARLIATASRAAQVIVVSHAPRLIEALASEPDCHLVALEKRHGETVVANVPWQDQPVWKWPGR
jgi:predicted ATPase